MMFISDLTKDTERKAKFVFRVKHGNAGDCRFHYLD